MFVRISLSLALSVSLILASEFLCQPSPRSPSAACGGATHPGRVQAGSQARGRLRKRGPQRVPDDFAGLGLRPVCLAQAPSLEVLAQERCSEQPCRARIGALARPTPGGVGGGRRRADAPHAPRAEMGHAGMPWRDSCPASRCRGERPSTSQPRRPFRVGALSAPPLQAKQPGTPASVWRKDGGSYTPTIARICHRVATSHRIGPRNSSTSAARCAAEYVDARQREACRAGGRSTSAP